LTYNAGYSTAIIINAMSLLFTKFEHMNVNGDSKKLTTFSNQFNFFCLNFNQESFDDSSKGPE